jgi:hypothetical protein
VEKEEIAILADLEKMGKKQEASNYQRVLLATSELIENVTPGDDKLITEELVDSRLRKAEISASAEAIAKERGEKIPIPNNVYALSFLIDDSKPLQKIYRDYLKGVIAEEKAKVASKYPAFDNEHPSDHGGSKTHFQDKAHAAHGSKETHHGVAV